MGLLRADPPVAALYLEDEVAAPGEEVSAVVSLGGARGRAELLYLNEWDAEGAEAPPPADGLLPIDNAPPPSAGVRCSEVVVAVAELDGEGHHQVVFEVPEDAPCSGADFVEWRVRASTGRGRRASVAEETLFVESGAGEDPEEPPETITRGDGKCDIEIVLESLSARAGGRVKGEVVLVATEDCEGLRVSVGLERRRESHPEHGSGSAPWLRRLDTVDAVKDRSLAEGERLELPFELRVPRHAAPTGSARDSSISYEVQAFAAYGFTANDVARRHLRVVTTSA